MGWRACGNGHTRARVQDCEALLPALLFTTRTNSLVPAALNSIRSPASKMIEPRVTRGAAAGAHASQGVGTASEGYFEGSTAAAARAGFVIAAAAAGTRGHSTAAAAAAGPGVGG